MTQIKSWRELRRTSQQRSSSSAAGRAAQRDARRRLFAESLEQRVLLTVVTETDPAANSHVAPAATDLVVTFDQPINSESATAQTLAVHSMQHGRLGIATVTTEGNVVTFNPPGDFLAGEFVQGTVTAGIQSDTNMPTDPYVWQFRTEVTAGGATFVDTLQSLGNEESLEAALGDLDGDGDLDAFVANRDAGNQVWFNNGGILSESGQSLGDHASFGVTLGDLDADGDLDAFVVNLGQANRVWINDGGVFSENGQVLGSANSLSVDLGDLDGDGDLDAVVANSLQSNVVWNNDSGRFTVGQVFGSGSSNGIALGDLDRDGDLDVFVANSYQANRIWINNDGQLSDSGQALGSHSSRDVSLGDVDGDGDLDAFVANSRQANRVWLNTDGAFSESGQVLGNDPSYGVALGDLDADGDLDAFVANVGGGNHAWLNESGTFSNSGQLLGSHDSASVSLGDVDGDGDLDALLANTGGNRLWRNQNPTFSVSPAVSWLPEGDSDTTTFSFTVQRAVDTRGVVSLDFAVSPAGVNPAQTEDFVGGVLPSGTLVFEDGVASLPVDVQVVGDVEVENDETFIVALSNPVGRNSVVTAPVARAVIRNDDNVDLGDLPIPFPTQLSDNGPSHNATGPTLGAVRDTESDGQPAQAADGDDGDGAPDDEDGVVFEQLLNAGQLSAAVTVNVSADARLDAWVDFDGDGSLGGAQEQIFAGEEVTAGDNVLQFAIPSASLQGTAFARFRVSTAGGLPPTGGAADGEVEDHALLIGSPGGSGVFGDSDQDLGSHSSLAVALGDVDGDGDLDAFVANSNREANRVWLNDGGEFADSGQTLGDHQSADIALGDVDGDGDLDAFVANLAGNRVWINGDTGFTDSGQSLGVKNSRSVALGDLDGDGDLDAFVANDSQDNRIWVNAGGRFADSGQSLGNHASRGVALGDLDGDGDLDAFVSNYGQPNRIWLNEEGGFHDSAQTLGDHLSQNASLGDLDADGDLDAFVVNTDDGDRVWLNEGGTFTDSGQTLGDHFSLDVALGDLDGDGDLDGLVANARSASALVPSPGNRVLLNEQGVFHDFGQALGDRSSFAVALGDVDNDGDLDAFSANYYVAGSSAPRVPEGNQVWLNLEGNTLISLERTNVTQAEGDTGTASFDFDVRRIGDLANPVTIDFSVSGGGVFPADGADFGGNLPSGMVTFAPDEASQTITVDVAGDTQVEPNESFVFSIANPDSESAEILNHRAEGTIENDDVTPLTVFLGLDGAEILENHGVAIFTASLSSPATADVTVALQLSGSATLDEDFVVSATEVVIAEGESSAELTVMALPDEAEEPNETVTVEITSATGAEIGIAQQTSTIVDDDGPRVFQVADLVPASFGFTIRFNDSFDESSINLFDDALAGRGPADLVVVGEATGPVAGSLVLDPSATLIRFIKTGAPLEPDTYTVTLRSSESGFQSTTGSLLDGDADGVAGGDYRRSFDVVPPPDATRLISLPDFTRGPGQEVHVPADSIGIPLSLSDGSGVTSVSLQIGYSPSLLALSGASLGAGAPEGATVEFTVINNTATQGIAVLTFTSPTALPAGRTTFATLDASVPDADASAIYRQMQIVDLRAVEVTDGTGALIPIQQDAAVHLVTFLGDTSGNGRLNAGDASRLARVAAQLDSGFGATPLVDPLVAADVSGNGRLNALDASLVAQFAAQLPVEEIPPLPDGVVIAAGRPSVFPDDASDGNRIDRALFELLGAPGQRIAAPSNRAALPEDAPANDRSGPPALSIVETSHERRAVPPSSPVHSGVSLVEPDEDVPLDVALTELFG